MPCPRQLKGETGSGPGQPDLAVDVPAQAGAECMTSSKVPSILNHFVILCHSESSVSVFSQYLPTSKHPVTLICRTNEGWWGTLGWICHESNDQEPSVIIPAQAR